MSDKQKHTVEFADSEDDNPLTVYSFGNQVFSIEGFTIFVNELPAFHVVPIKDIQELPEVHQCMVAMCEGLKFLLNYGTNKIIPCK